MPRITRQRVAELRLNSVSTPSECHLFLVVLASTAITQTRAAIIYISHSCSQGTSVHKTHLKGTVSSERNARRHLTHQTRLRKAGNKWGPGK